MLEQSGPESFFFLSPKAHCVLCRSLYQWLQSALAFICIKRQMEENKTLQEWKTDLHVQWKYVILTLSLPHGA